ncbi:hypothetical protein [Kineococcus arenarius]|uniref:hypothetical protein n=1 Tax=unclassified Kineococcus TaxID=2621656 RepID=UPI003D7DF66C
MDSWRCRPRAARVVVTATAAVVLLTGCSGDDEVITPAPTTTTVEPTSSPSGSTSTPQRSDPAFDCPAVRAAQDELDSAFTAELERLDVPRGDPRAQAVYALVTTEEGPAYYAAVLAAAPAELSGDAQLVLDYYQRLARAAGDLDPGTGSTADLTTAMAALDEATAAVDDPAAGTDVVAAQERLQSALERSCSGDADSPTATASGSADRTVPPTASPAAPVTTSGAATGA